MSERIEGLSIGLDLDTLKLDSGLTSLKSKLSLVNSEMRANLSAFDRGDKSVERYQTRIDGLNKKLEVQKVVVDSAQKSYEKMVKEHGEGSEQAEKAARNYNHEVAALSNLERQISKTKAELKQLTQEQKIADSGWTKTGDNLINLGNRLSTISDRSKELGRNLTRSITMPAVGAASALAGITLVKGFGRLVGIDTARAKLVGLGHDAESVETIMTSALDSVRGTAFGLDEAATTAANAVAAGVEGSEELTRYLSLTGDVAAIAGSSLGEMGSILNKVTTANRAYNGELGQLSDRGIPIYQWLAEEANTTAESIRDMAADGQISAEMLMNAIEKNIGGAAQKMGEESFTAGIANMWAAVGRLGASFLDAGGEGGGFFSQMKPLIADFTNRLDDMGGIAERAGVKFGEMFTGFLDRAKSVKAWYDELSPTMQNIINKTVLIGSVITIGLGPLLLVFGTLAGAIAKVSFVLGGFFKWIGKVKVLGVFGKNVADGTKKLTLFSRVLTLLTGPVGWIIAGITALGAGFIYAYKNSDDFRESVQNALGRVKDGFAAALDYVQPAIETVVSTLKNFGESITQFWQENKDTIVQALTNIFSFASELFGHLVDIAQRFLPAVEMIFKTTWDAIVMIIEVAKSLILGTIQILSGLLTGDVSKMLEGIKAVFFDGLAAIVGFVVGFVDDIIGFFHNLYMKLVGNSIIPDMINAIIEWFVNLGKRAGELVRNLVTTVINFFTNLKDRTIARVREMRDGLVNRFNDLKDQYTTIGRNVRDAVTGFFTELKDNTIKRVLDMRTEAVRRFTVMKDSFVDLGRDIKDNITDRFDDMVTAAKELPGRIGDGIKNMASKATSGVKSFANSIGSTLETGINKVVGGMNDLLGKISVDLRIPTINIPQYATGTKNHPGGMAVVGEEGRELAHIPGRGYTMLGINGAELLNLPKGSSVLPNKETERLLVDGMGLPGYKTGVGRAFDWVKGKAQSGWQNMTSLASDAVGWLLESPKKLFDKAMEFVGVSMPSASDFPGALMRGSFAKLREGIEQKLKSVQSEVMPTSPTFGPPFRMTSPFGLRFHPIHKKWLPHNGIDYAAPNGTPIPSQSAGNVSFSGWMGGYGNSVMVKSGIYDYLYAHNSRNLVRAGQSVSRGQILGLVGSTGNSTGPHVHYEVRKNGRAINPKGFKTGGLIKEKMMALLGDGGWPEWVIPTDPARATDAMKLLALAGRDIESRGGAKRPHQLPNITNTAGSEYLEKMLEKLSEQVADTKEIISLLLKLVVKDNDVYLDGRLVARGISPHIAEEISRLETRANRSRGRG
ncbi:peptidoglycan DD-metalloendopeptidase family protein [Alkalihalophilus marmarensis]|jgi:phage-related protein|uniref:peptidoglycan DD-metalloendopeptidase family protein n=1 Tax=Alkalihalophilus marmarensis TaxID=521377 RepID=UPI00203E73EB|nr:peptidoglycan DD-metalloendopeptidase family protein [Alkalihalophilus marmarensis]MCM3487899.1 peptidoglycan DD-metalloendopeptidase family protein [Alkalihalophilus marmarensis]